MFQANTPLAVAPAPFWHLQINFLALFTTKHAFKLVQNPQKKHTQKRSRASGIVCRNQKSRATQRPTQVYSNTNNIERHGIECTKARVQVSARVETLVQLGNRVLARQNARGARAPRPNLHRAGASRRVVVWRRRSWRQPLQDRLLTSRHLEGGLVGLLRARQLKLRVAHLPHALARLRAAALLRLVPLALLALDLLLKHQVPVFMFQVHCDRMFDLGLTQVVEPVRLHQRLQVPHGIPLDWLQLKPTST